MSASATGAPSHRLLLTLALTALAIIVIRTAWVSDDAYLTFRTIDNLIHGYGPRWNVADRVQAYTHPLWMLVLSVAYFCTREIYFTSIGVSIACTLWAAWLIGRRIALDELAALLAITILTCSKSFVDYSTSGLENPLTALLLVLFFGAWLRQTPSPRTLLWQSALAGLVALNRMDAILITLPALLTTIVRVRDMRAVTRALAVGFAPFAAWEIFSIFYYGFPFPNTAYAKLGAGLDRGDLLKQGALYFANSVANDPLTLAICGAAVALALSSARALRPLAFGILLECVYVLTIGGDFMSGRLFAAPLVVSVIVIARLGTAHLNGRWPLAFVAVIGLAVSAKYPSFTSDATYGLNRGDAVVDRAGISDERAYYYQSSGMLTMSRDRVFPDSHWTKAGLQLRDQLQGQPPKVIVDPHAGFYGFSAGPGLHIVDPYALGEPLLARLPAETPWRIGHFKRNVPDGYVETLQTDQNQIRDVSLRIYYDKLALITRAPLFAPHRLSTILKMNLGEYDGLIRAYTVTSQSK